MEINYVTDFLNLKDIFVSKVVHSDSKVSFYIETNSSTHICLHCGSQTSKIHDYRNQTIKELPFPFKQCFPKALSIDEFKGDTNGEKYQCILVDSSG